MICASPTSTYTQADGPNCAPRGKNISGVPCTSQARGLEMLQQVAAQHSLMQTSILIVSFNTRDLTRECLLSVLRLF